MTSDQIIDAFLIPLAWETVNGERVAWPYAVTRHPVFGATWVAYRFGVPLADEVSCGVACFPTEAAAIAACEADHRSEAVKTWDIAKIEALVGAATLSQSDLLSSVQPHTSTIDHLRLVSGASIRLRTALATIRGRT